MVRNRHQKSRRVDGRSAALAVLNTLAQNEQTLDRVLEEYLDRNPQMDNRERSLMHALVFGTLRWKAKIDHIIGAFSSRPLEKIEPGILNILRIGMFQLFYLDRIPPSAAVNTAVELSKHSAPAWVVGFVNAVLRKATVSHREVTFPDIEKEPVRSIALRQSFPEWIVQRWLERFGLPETVALCTAVNRIPPITLRTNTLKTDRNRLVAALEDEAQRVVPSIYVPDGILMNAPVGPIAEMNSYRRGWFQVQDEAAQAVSFLLAPRPGERILDACAGLGGKTGHIVQLMQNRGAVLALDIDGNRLSLLKEQMGRMGAKIVDPRRFDLVRENSKEILGEFDRILLDAPCSGLGVLRRNPDAKWKCSPETLMRNAQKQLQLMESLACLVKPSGILVYAVCSNEPEEGQSVLNRFLKSHAEFVIEDSPKHIPDGMKPMLSGGGVLWTLPSRHDTDGFYAVRLKRTQ